VKSICLVCLKHFPLERKKLAFHAEKDVRNAIDEACWKTKLLNSENIRSNLCLMYTIVLLWVYFYINF
jgi:hypothetical protein